jgi:hypothetical protein
VKRASKGEERAELTRRELWRERRRILAEVRAIEKAVGALDRKGKKGGPLSVAGRRRISEAQHERWRKWRAQQARLRGQV